MNNGEHDKNAFEMCFQDFSLFSLSAKIEKKPKFGFYTMRKKFKNP
jgi:hypothetical protein